MTRPFALGYALSLATVLAGACSASHGVPCDDPQPVCGTDGVSYENRCAAELAEATADYPGTCNHAEYHPPPETPIDTPIDDPVARTCPAIACDLGPECGAAGLAVRDGCTLCACEVECAFDEHCLGGYCDLDVPTPNEPGLVPGGVCRVPCPLVQCDNECGPMGRAPDAQGCDSCACKCESPDDCLDGLDCGYGWAGGDTPAGPPAWSAPDPAAEPPPGAPQFGICR